MNERCDILIKGGMVIDGGGGERRRADVAVSGDRIVALGDLGRPTNEHLELIVRAGLPLDGRGHRARRAVNRGALDGSDDGEAIC